MAEQKNELQVILKEQGVEKNEASALLEAFGAPFEEAGAILTDYQLIKVTDSKDVKTMQEARTKRLALKKVRTTVENKRKELKSNIVKQGRAIDSVAKFVKEVITPAEQYLELQENFAKIEAEKKAAELLAKRTEQVSEYTNPTMYNLAGMDNEQFDALMAELKKQHEADLAAQKKAEEERIAAQEAEEKKRAEMEAENARLKAEAEEREKKEAAEREAREAEEAEKRKAAEQAEREAQAENRRIMDIRVDLLEYAHSIQTVDDAEKKADGLQKHYDKLPEADQHNPVIEAAYNKSKAEIVELRQFIEQRLRDEERAKKEAAEKEAQRLELVAPDKEKLTRFADALGIIRSEKIPAVKSKEAQAIVNHVDDEMHRLEEYIRTELKKLDKKTPARG